MREQFDELRGRRIMFSLGEMFNLRVTDTVREEIMKLPINARTNKPYEDQVARQKWLKDSQTPIQATGRTSGKNEGERSIADAIESVSKSLRDPDQKVYIASDDKIFNPNKELGGYSDVRLTSAELVQMVERRFNAMTMRNNRGGGGAPALQPF